MYTATLSTFFAASWPITCSSKIPSISLGVGKASAVPVGPNALRREVSASASRDLRSSRKKTDAEQASERGEVRWLGGRSRGSRDSESKTRRTVIKDSPLLKWELAPVLLPPCRRSGCSGSGSPRSTGPAAPAALVPRRRPRRPRPPLASVVAILPAPPPAKATIVAIVPRCTPPKERAPPRPAFQVLFLLSLLTAPQQKKKEIATFVCVFYSDLAISY